MTTPTTNYGWLKPDPAEAADIRVINTLLDDMDADIKAVQDALQSKIYTIGQYRIKRKISVTGSGALYYLNSLTPDLWEEEWLATGNTGSWTFPETGVLTFTSAGIYKINYSFTSATFQSSTTSGYLSMGLYLNTGGSLVARTEVFIASNTCDNVTIFPRTTVVGSVYVSTSSNISVGTEYKFGLKHTTSSGSINMLFNPIDIDPFRSQVTIECVRPL